MFENLDGISKEKLFIALKSMVENKEYWGEVFHNGDPGHPVYIAGAEQISEKPYHHSDNESTNIIYIMLKELSVFLKEEENISYTWWYDFSTWQNFCKFALIMYKKQRQ